MKLMTKIFQYAYSLKDYSSAHRLSRVSQIDQQITRQGFPVTMRIAMLPSAQVFVSSGFLFLIKFVKYLAQEHTSCPTCMPQSILSVRLL